MILQLEPLDPSRARVDLAIAALRGVLERLEKIPASASLSHRRACIHSLLAGFAGTNPGEGAEVAMTLLRQAIAAGFRDHRGLADDRDLDPLRARPDFRLMMNDLAFPADPFAR